MKINQPRKILSRKILVPLIAVLALCVILLAVTYIQQSNSGDPDNMTPTAVDTEGVSSDDTTSPNSSANNKSDIDAGTDKTPVQYDTPEDSAPSQNTLTGVINYTNTSGGNLVIRNTINQRVSDGTCRLTLYNKSTDKSVTRTAPIVTDPHSSTCQGFSVPISELSSGLWQITILITSDNQKGILEDSVVL